MKKLMLATITYRMNGPVEPFKQNNLVLINSSSSAFPADDYRAAIEAVYEWFDKSRINLEGGILQDVLIQETIIAGNPEPPALYTEADLVTFGNFMAQKILRIVAYKGSTHLNSLQVWDSDIANWKDEMKNKD
jgi:hypothetical protein